MNSLLPALTLIFLCKKRRIHPSYHYIMFAFEGRGGLTYAGELQQVLVSFWLVTLGH
jgi:hypothetical protein